MKNVLTRASAEAGAFDVAPVTPGLLRGGLHSITASVGDEVGRKAASLEKRCKSVDVLLLVTAGVAYKEYTDQHRQHPWHSSLGANSPWVYDGQVAMFQAL